MSADDIANEVPVPMDLAGVSREKLDALVAAISEKTGKTISGSESPDGPATTEKMNEPAQPNVLTGRDVDWSEYDLEYSVQHLYPRAVYRETPQGYKWVVTIDEFMTTEKEFRSFGKRVNIPGTTDGKSTEPLNGGEFLTQMAISPDGWRLEGVMPTQGGKLGILLTRKTTLVLPDPMVLKKAVEVDPPTEAELARAEGDALDWANENGLIKAEDAGRVEATPELKSLESVALAINPPTGHDPCRVTPETADQRRVEDLSRAAADEAAAMMKDSEEV